jgi:ABC-type phosphate transport system substrate-binding protein
MSVQRLAPRLLQGTLALFVGGSLLCSQATIATAQVALDPKLAAYERVSGVSGNLNSIGSDTLNNLMTLWAEGFRASYPNVNIQIEGKGSSTAPSFDRGDCAAWTHEPCNEILGDRSV